MAQNAIRVGNEAATDVVTTWTNEWKLNPTEGMAVADFVDKPEVVGKFGQTIKVRFIPAIRGTSMNTVSNAAGGSTLTRGNLTWITNTDTVATGTSQMVYGAISVNRNVWNQVRDDADFRAKQKAALNAGMVEKVDSDVFANAANLSNVITQADLDDAAFRNGWARLRKTAMGKLKIGESDIRLYIPPEESQNALGIPALKEYQIRGNLGTAATGRAVDAYGIKWDVSGLVYTVGGVTAYCPLILKDAWFLAYNETPHPLADQVDGLTDAFIVVAEYATFEEFDSSGVVFALTIP
jgi:hypothetical protein